MRAKEYLKKYRPLMFYFEEVNQIVEDLYGIRSDMDATNRYYNLYLTADILYNEWKELGSEYGYGGLVNPRENQCDREIDQDIVEYVRDELLGTVKNDKTFGYITYFLSRSKGDIPSHEEIEEAINQEPYDELAIANQRILELEEKIEQLSSKEDPQDNKQPNETRTMKVTTDILVKLLGLLNVKKDISTDGTKIANLIGYLTGFSAKTIRQRLSNNEELTKYHKEEVEKTNELLKHLNINISITYNKER